MADEKTEHADEHTAEAKPAKKGGSKKLLIIIIAAAIVLAGGGFFAYSKFFGHKEKKEASSEHGEEGKGKSVLIPVDPFVVNLSEQGRYLKITMQFEVADPAYEEFIKQKVPNIRDAVITLLSSKSSESVSGPEGKLQLKDEILLRANQAIGKDMIKTVYFTDFVMQ